MESFNIIGTIASVLHLSQLQIIIFFLFGYVVYNHQQLIQNEHTELDKIIYSSLFGLGLYAILLVLFSLLLAYLGILIPSEHFTPAKLNNFLAMILFLITIIIVFKENIISGETHTYFTLENIVWFLICFFFIIHLFLLIVAIFIKITIYSHTTPILFTFSFLGVILSLITYIAFFEPHKIKIRFNYLKKIQKRKLVFINRILLSLIILLGITYYIFPQNITYGDDMPISNHYNYGVYWENDSLDNWVILHWVTKEITISNSGIFGWIPIDCKNISSINNLDIVPCNIEYNSKKLSNPSYDLGIINETFNSQYNKKIISFKPYKTFDFKQINLSLIGFKKNYVKEDDFIILKNKKDDNTLSITVQNKLNYSLELLPITIHEFKKSNCSISNIYVTERNLLNNHNVHLFWNISEDKFHIKTEDGRYNIFTLENKQLKLNTLSLKSQYEFFINITFDCPQNI